MGKDITRHNISDKNLATLLGYPGSKILSIQRVPTYGIGEVEFICIVDTPNDLHDQPSPYGDCEPCKVCGACFRCAVGRHSECHGCRCECNAPFGAGVRCGGPCADRVDATPVDVARSDS